MRFYKFWSKSECSVQGQHGQFSVSCYGYSNQSLADALEVAQQRAEKVANAMANAAPQEGGYYVSSYPFREPIIEQFDENGKTIAIVSRNHYGCLVLNTPSVFFADVDKPAGSNVTNPFLSILKMFGVQPKPTKSFEENLIDNIELHCRQDSSIGLRLYRTTNGYRILLTSEQIPSRAARSRNLLQSLQADRLYITLCKSQDCYRARLTPKPWRCGLTTPPCRFPFLTESQKHKFQQWLDSYEERIQQYATCALIGQFGSTHVEPTIEKIVKLHDHYVLNQDLPIG